MFALDLCKNAYIVVAAMLTYLQQLDERCAEADLDLVEVCRAEGVADTTLARWRRGETNCREATAQALFARIEKMAVDTPSTPASGKVPASAGAGS